MAKSVKGYFENEKDSAALNREVPQAKGAIYRSAPAARRLP